eukprot:Rhum_TRINITY_DN14310_c21_g1::Rhum_TRINITY_DN14310_c21_g1_i1::g.82282::m.82282
MSLRKGSLWLAYEACGGGGRHGVERETLLRVADAVEESTDTLVAGMQANPHPLIHPRYREFESRRSKVVEYVRKVTNTFAKLVNDGYHSRTGSISQHYLDSYLLTDHGHLDNADFQSICVACVLLAVKVQEMRMPSLSLIGAHFVTDPRVIQRYEVVVLSGMRYQTHVITMWDHLQAWVRLFHTLPRCTLLDVAVAIDSTGTEEVVDLECFADARAADDATGPLRGLAALLEAAALNRSKSRPASAVGVGVGGWRHRHLRVLERAAHAGMTLALPEADPAHLSVLSVIPFSLADVLHPVNLERNAPQIYVYAQIKRGHFAEFPPAIVALACILVGAVMSRNYEQTLSRLFAMVGDMGPSRKGEHAWTQISRCFVALHKGAKEPFDEYIREQEAYERQKELEQQQQQQHEQQQQQQQQQLEQQQQQQLRMQQQQQLQQQQQQQQRYPPPPRQSLSPTHQQQQQQPQ